MFCAVIFVDVLCCNICSQYFLNLLFLFRFLLVLNPAESFVERRQHRQTDWQEQWNVYCKSERNQIKFSCKIQFYRGITKKVILKVIEDK